MDNKEMEELKFKYKYALKILQTKLEILYDELYTDNNYNYIEHINTRIKSNKSIYEKLEKDDIEINAKNIKEQLHDIAGMRIVCLFLSDIKKVEELIKKDKDITIIKRKDYINRPKETGYSSLHLTVLVPVPSIDKTEYMSVEIQIRTIAMDMWASLEHKLLYKSHRKCTPELRNLMIKFAKITKDIDNTMEKLMIESSVIPNQSTNEVNTTKIKKIEDTSMLKYELALNIMKDKINNINYELSETKDVNPIEHIKTRIKKPRSIVKKLEKSNYEITKENINNHVHDLIGIRIVCSFLSDLEEIKNILESDPTIKIIKRKDYINNPKPNGYRSYHINAIVPVKMINRTEYVETEIQIRTIAMDMWASLEHKICYQKDGEIPYNIKEKLKNISNQTNIIDNTVNNLILNQMLEEKPKTLKYFK